MHDEKKSNQTEPRKHPLIHEIYPAGCLKGQRAFIIGGGGSVREQDLSLLDGEFTIGTNRTIMEYESTAVFVYDRGLYLKIWDHKEGATPHEDMKRVWLSMKTTKLLRHRASLIRIADAHPEDTGIYWVPTSKGKVHFPVSWDDMWLGNNSGHAAMMIAVVMGANPIYLLGIDCSKHPDHGWNWHGGYHDQFGNPIKCNPSSATPFIRSFTETAPFLHKNGIKVYNCSPISKLDVFEKVDYEKAVHGS